ncbi:MAG: nuclear transport factor 2 family protein [Parvibaculum sedimenti]|uniref:SnoaL-like domain-containing protein n=1 Tax=Parvibaculum sedimenti TaxID=2608632 RepID=UPI003BB516B1
MDMNVNIQESTKTIAEDFVTLCKAGKADEAGERYWADDVLSIEPSGSMPPARGKEALHKKGEWWEGAHDVHRMDIDGPYVNGNQFIVRFTVDLTVKETGARMKMDETGLYTLKDGKIAEERFFYSHN